MVLIFPGIEFAAKSCVDLNYLIELEEALTPPTHLNFDAFKGDIEEMIIQQGFTDDEVIANLARKGFQTSTRSLRRRLAVGTSAVKGSLERYQMHLQRQLTTFFIILSCNSTPILHLIGIGNSSSVPAPMWLQKARRRFHYPQTRRRRFEGIASDDGED